MIEQLGSSSSAISKAKTKEKRFCFLGANAQKYEEPIKETNYKNNCR